MPCTGRTSMLGMLRAARRKLALTSAPSTIRALLQPSFSKRSRRPLVLPASIAAWSSTMMPPSLALAESAWRKASARTFFGRSMAWLRTTGPNERPPPRNRLTRAEPCRALPVPFWRYIFLPVRQISARFLTLWVPRWRLASCQLTQRWIRSARGSRPKIASDSSTEPAALPSRVVTCSSMSRSLSGRRLRRCLALGRRSGAAFVARQAEFSRLRHAVGQPLLHGVAHRDPTTLSARHRALDQDEAARDVGLHHFEIERSHALDTQVAGHLLALEGLARVLAAAGRPMRTMRDRHAVRGAQAAEVPALHRPGKTLADRRAGHVDILADDKMVGRDLGADRDQRIVADAELGDLALGLHLGHGKVPALRLRDVLDLARAGAELQRDVAVLVLGAMRDHLALGQPENRDRHVFAGVGEQAGHPHLLCNHPGTHGSSVLLEPKAALELDLDVDARRQIELHQRVYGLRRRIDDVEQPLVGAHLELLAALLVDVRRAVDGELLDLGRQRDRPAHLGAGALGGIHDLARRRIEDAMVERFEPDADVLAVHGISDDGGRTTEVRSVVRSRLFRPSLSVLGRLSSVRLLDDAGDHAGTDRAPALADGEAQLLLHGDRHDQLHRHRHVVARHDPLGPFRQVHDAGHVGGAEVELRPVVGEERRVPAALLLGQDVGLGLELGVRLHRARLAQDLAALHLVLVDAAQQRTDV